MTRLVSRIVLLVVVPALLVGACGDELGGSDRTQTVTIGEGARAGPEGSRGGGGSSGRAPVRDAPELPGECPGEQLEPAGAEVAALERAAFCLVNEIRVDRGIARLSRDPRLADAAKVHSRDMDRNDYFAHVSPGGTDLIGWVRGTGYLKGRGGFRLAENIAFGTGAAGTPAQIVAGWMDSASHRENILDGRLREAGVGVVIGAPNPPATGAIYTQIFGSPR